jgi:hypothetical protein
VPEGFLPRVRPGRPGESDLYRRLGSTGSDAMPPLGRMSRDERGLALIRAWIEGMSGSLSTPSPRPALSPDSRRVEPTRLPPVRTSIHRANRADTGFSIPRAEGDPDAPPAVWMCDGGPCRRLAAAVAWTDAAKQDWVVRPLAPPPRGGCRLILLWPGRAGRRNVLVF